ncbi:MAG TPA: GNAT family N-acetyltransferase [Anaerolineales bacterium]|nr:GNAT family N-acetyltransferase [Anaerolineales bacterium]
MPALATDETITQIFGKTRTELTALIEHHSLTAQAWLSSRSPQAMRFQGKGIQASSTGLKIPLLNLAFGCNFPVGTSEAEIEAEIEALKAFFEARSVPWYWWMNTSPLPKDIAGLLEKHGLVHYGAPLPAMAASLAQDLTSFPKYPKHIPVWRAQNLADLRRASKIRRLAFGFPDGEALTYFEDMRSDWLEDDSVKLFLAGESESSAAAIGALIHAAGIPGIYVMATLPDHHRKGLGKAILARLLFEAASERHALVALTASKAGFGLYSQFGFQNIFGFDLYAPTK